MHHDAGVGTQRRNSDPKDQRWFKRLGLMCVYSRKILETVFTFNKSFI